MLMDATFASNIDGPKEFFERLPDLAVELVGLKVDVIVAFVTAASLAARKATATIPIVMAYVSDPVDAAGSASACNAPTVIWFRQNERAARLQFERPSRLYLGGWGMGEAARL